MKMFALLCPLRTGAQEATETDAPPPPPPWRSGWFPTKASKKASYLELRGKLEGAEKDETAELGQSSRHSGTVRYCAVCMPLSPLPSLHPRSRSRSRPRDSRESPSLRGCTRWRACGGTARRHAYSYIYLPWSLGGLRVGDRASKIKQDVFRVGPGREER
ncbi:hypothetical protein LX36DRAFT_224798 [Colletotrichum falcatum]|nr:hypothetical protein LX36DRAFT_452113 [Colletotrichum falcatum]KAK1994060.1 hypothetical protein LX36DRAFT_224798 [Colletotrichum falcatum]